MVVGGAVVWHRSFVIVEFAGEEAGGGVVAPVGDGSAGVGGFVVGDGGAGAEGEDAAGVVVGIDGGVGQGSPGGGGLAAGVVAAAGDGVVGMGGGFILFSEKPSLVFLLDQSLGLSCFHLRVRSRKSNLAFRLLHHPQKPKHSCQ